MTITYPLAHPAAPGFRRFVISPRTTAAMSSSPFSYAIRTYDWMGDRWEIDADVTAGKRDEMADWLAFIAKLKSPRGTFSLGPQTGAGATPRGVGTGTPLVNGANQTGESLITDGWTISQTGILKAGDFFQLESRLYMVLTDANSDGGGNATFDIWPRLRKSPADNAALTVTNPKGIFRLPSAPSISIDEALIYGISFSAIEDVTFT